MSIAIVLAVLLSAEPAALNPTGGLFRDPADVPWLVETRPDALALDPPPAVDHSPDMPPVGSQGSLPSCTSWAFAYYYKTYQEWLERGWPVTEPAHQFSPTFLYNMANAGGNVGSYYTDNMRLLVDFGCATFADCPNSSDPVPWPGETAYARALPYRCAEARYINCGTDPGIIALKQHIADGDNAVLPINVWSNFDNINNFDTCYCSIDRYGQNRGGHYITFVGYDDNRATNDGPGAFRLVNSWGTGWGNHGYAWMSYAAVKDAQISYRIGLYLLDRVGYTPRLVTRARVEHESREDVRFDAGIRRDGVPAWSKTFLERDLDRRGAHPFPDHFITLDLTDGADSLEAIDTSCVSVECRDVHADGVTGELVGATAVDLVRGAFGTAGAVGVPIPDDGTAAGAGFALPGQRLHWPGFQRFPAHAGASELRAALDTLRAAGEVGAGGAIWTSPAMGDLDADGRNEVVFGADDGIVRSVNGEHCSLSWSDSLGSAACAAPGIGDLDADGRLDVVAGATDGTVRAWDYAGGRLWTHMVGAPLSGGLTVGDPDCDGRLEVLLAAGDGTVASLNGSTGDEEWSVTLPGIALGAPALADIDGDGRQDVVVGVADSCYRVLDATTGVAVGVSTLAATAASAPTIADLDLDGDMEIVVGLSDGRVCAFSGDDGTVLWSFTAADSVSASPATGDVDGDGLPDVVFGARDSTVYALTGGGVPLWTAKLGGSVNSAPALGYVDADGALDVIVGADDGRLYVLAGTNGNRLVARVTGGAIRSAPALGDMDGDGRLDVAVGSDDGRLYIFGGSPAGVGDRPGSVAGRDAAWLKVAPSLVRTHVSVRFALDAERQVRLQVHDLSGRVVRTLASGARPAGRHLVDWRGDDDYGRQLADGIYFCRLAAGDYHATEKVVLQK